MGNNQSVSSSLLKLNNDSENDNISSSNNINDGFVSEDYLAQIIDQIMAKDELHWYWLSFVALLGNLCAKSPSKFVSALQKLYSSLFRVN